MASLDALLSTRPLYLQVRDVLVNRIVVGDWKPGGTLPNETALAQQLGISIGTVRKALDIMESDRIVTRRQGRGTFVNDYTDQDAFPFSTIYDCEGARINGRKHGKSVTMVPASKAEADRLRIKEGEELIRVERAREHQGHVFMTEICLLPAKYYGRQPEEMSTYRLCAIAQLNSIIVSHADERVDIVAANENDAGLLSVPVGKPLLRLDRVIFSDRDLVLEWRVAHCHMKNESYVVRFK